MNFLFLGIIALAISGLHSLLIVAMRTQLFKSILNQDLFRISLVIHVDLSILVWLSCCIMHYVSQNFNYKLNSILKNLHEITLIAILLIGFGPFISSSSPIINNYIPIIHNIFFIVGIAIFFSIMIVISIINIISLKDHFFLSQIFILAAFIFYRSYSSLDIKEKEFYEHLFWGCGHAIQFLYTQFAMVIWSDISGVQCRKLLLLNYILVIPLIFLGVEDKALFTTHMIYFGGIAPTLHVLLILKNYTYKNSAVDNSLLVSIFLFLLGGIIGLNITGTNVKIPAHYHGSIISITVAACGYAYRIFIKQIMAASLDKIAKIQPIFYGFGQTLHILGLAFAGGYNVMRKDISSEMLTSAKIAMGFMGLGGLIAIIGGLIFIIIFGLIFYKKQYETI